MEGFRLTLEEDPDVIGRIIKAGRKFVKFFASPEAGPDFQTSYLDDYNAAYKKKQFQSAFEILEQLESTVNNTLEGRYWPNFLKSQAFINFANEDNSIDEEGCGSDQSPAKPSLNDPLFEGMDTIPEDKVVTFPTTNTHNRVQKLPNIVSNPEVPKVKDEAIKEKQKKDEREELGDLGELLNPYDPTFDPPDVRNRETLQVRPVFERSGSQPSSSQSLRHTQGLSYFPEHDHRNYPNAANTLRKKVPTVGTITEYFIDEPMPRENTRNPAAAYHARASTVNPTTRQNSAFHSMATDTSDTYSAFSNEDPERIEKRRRHQEKKTVRESTNANGQSNLSGPFQAKSSTKNVVEEGTGYAHSQLAKNKPMGFFQLLNEKLMAVITERRNDERAKEKIKRFREQMKAQAEERISNPAMSQVGEDFEETDDSILDDAISRHEISQKLEERESTRSDSRRRFGSSDDLLRDRSRGCNQNHYNTSTMRSNRSTSNRDFGDGRSIISRAPSSFQAVTRVPPIQSFENHNGGDQRYNTMRSTHSQYSSSHRNASQDQFGQNSFGSNQHYVQPRANGSYGSYGHSGSSSFGGQTGQSQYAYRQQQQQTNWGGYNGYRSMNQNSQPTPQQNFGNNEMMSRFNQMSLEVQDRNRHNNKPNHKRNVEIRVQMPDRYGKEETHTIHLSQKVITLNDVKEDLPKRAENCIFYQKQHHVNLGVNWINITPNEPLVVYESMIELRAS